jgi:alpha-L-rhamnosidase
VLTRFGHSDVAYTLLLQETYPSWLYPVKMGATTIWERWDGQKPDSTFQNTAMNSFNHYAYGAIGDWMYRVVAGINTEKPGYKHIRIQPRPDKRLTFAKATYESSYGQIASGWEMKDGKMIVTVKIPANTVATVVLPGAQSETVLVNNAPIKSQGFTTSSTQAGETVFQAGSGSYTFSYAFK